MTDFLSPVLCWLLPLSSVPTKGMRGHGDTSYISPPLPISPTPHLPHSPSPLHSPSPPLSISPTLHLPYSLSLYTLHLPYSPSPLLLISLHLPISPTLHLPYSPSPLHSPVVSSCARSKPETWPFSSPPASSPHPTSKQLRAGSLLQGKQLLIEIQL